MTFSFWVILLTLRLLLLSHHLLLLHLHHLLLLHLLFFSLSRKMLKDFTSFWQLQHLDYQRIGFWVSRVTKQSHLT